VIDEAGDASGGLQDQLLGGLFEGVLMEGGLFVAGLEDKSRPAAPRGL